MSPTHSILLYASIEILTGCHYIPVAWITNCKNLMTEPLIVDYYTDILCVWAWIAQRRIDELNAQLGDKIEIRRYYIDVFGDVAKNIDAGWQQRGGYTGFAEHVEQAAASFDDAPINSAIWSEVRPVTSANAHLTLKAVELVYDKQRSVDAALMLRNSFFNEAQDIGRLEVILQLIGDFGLDRDLVNNSIGDGTAMAALMRDYQTARENNIKGSPSYVLDGGRQILYGNVGYRVIRTNIEELLKHPRDEASWC
jgi:predicted DsbA family dithiol-disulfide isomerase